MASTSARRAGGPTLPSEELDPDAPGAQPHPTSAQTGPSNARGTSNGANNGGDEEQVDDVDSGDEIPDYSLVAKLASKVGATGGGGLGESSAAAASTTATAFQAFIPKRGEKDFEPTGFGGQNRALEKSRKALFDAISGERHTASKTISVATWEPRLQRAVVEHARGVVFTSVGYTRRVGVREDGTDEDLGNPSSPLAGVTKEGIWYPRTRARVELLPEETLWMIERGALDCRIRCEEGKGKGGRDVISLHSHDSAGEEGKQEEDREWVTLSVQHAASFMTFADGCTRERYQVFAYLKRQGYIVQRASVVEELRATAAQARLKASSSAEGKADLEADSILRDPQRPLRLVTIVDLVLYPFRRAFQLAGDGLDIAGRALMRAAAWIRSIVGRILSRGRRTTTTAPRSFADQQRGTGLLGIGGRTWDSFDSVFSQLQIVPTGHDLPYKRSSPKSLAQRFPIVYYAWRPATRYKKTDPPLPEYRIAVADARSTYVPTLRDWTALYDQVPRVDIDLIQAEGGEAGGAVDAEQLKRAQDEKKRNDESYGRFATRKIEAAKQAQRERSAAAAKAGEGGGASRSLSRLVELLPVPLRAALARLTSVLGLLSSTMLNSYSHCPAGTLRLSNAAGAPDRGRGGNGRGSPPRGRTGFVNVFPPLKAGRRSVILAIVDNGTSSMLRFGETEFHKWAIAGLDRPGGRPRKSLGDAA